MVGTQNPISFANRQALSPALANRFYKIDVKEHPIPELRRILIHQGVEPSEAIQKLQAYKEKNETTLIPALKATPRDLLRQTPKTRI